MAIASGTRLGSYEIESHLGSDFNNPFVKNLPVYRVCFSDRKAEHIVDLSEAGNAQGASDGVPGWARTSRFPARAISASKKYTAGYAFSIRRPKTAIEQTTPAAHFADSAGATTCRQRARDS
jgi:hypothetical protein